MSLVYGWDDEYMKALEGCMGLHFTEKSKLLTDLFMILLSWNDRLWAVWKIETGVSWCEQCERLTLVWAVLNIGWCEQCERLTQVGQVYSWHWCKCEQRLIFWVLFLWPWVVCRKSIKTRKIYSMVCDCRFSLTQIKASMLSKQVCLFVILNCMPGITLFI